jgi:hypothetical protein
LTWEDPPSNARAEEGWQSACFESTRTTKCADPSIWSLPPTSGLSTTLELIATSPFIVPDLPEADLWPGSSIVINQAAANASQWEMNSERIWEPNEGRLFTLASNNSSGYLLMLLRWWHNDRPARW